MHGRKYQFTLASVFAIITLLCVYMALPGAVQILATLLFWLLIGAAVMISLMLLQSPLILLVKRHIQSKDDADDNH